MVNDHVIHIVDGILHSIPCPWPILDAIVSMLIKAEECPMTYLFMLWVLGADNIYSSLSGLISTSTSFDSTATHLLTTEHPSQNFLTLDLTFIPLN